MSVLELDDVHAYYGNIHALKGISLTVEQGEIVALIGANGAGKTTTLRPSPGSCTARRARCTWRAGTSATCRPTPWHGRPGLCPKAAASSPASPSPRTWRWAPTSWTTRPRSQRGIENAFTLFPRLKERAQQKGGTLSGGEQQMLAIGPGPDVQPQVLLMDEPSMGLAPVLVDQIFEIIQELNARGTTILLVEQNALMALSIAHRGYVLQTGHIVLTDTGANLKANDLVRKAGPWGSRRFVCHSRVSAQ